MPVFVKKLKYTVFYTSFSNPADKAKILEKLRPEAEDNFISSWLPMHI